MLYIASPYSHPEAAVRNARYLAAFKYTTQCLHQGLIAFSPIVYGHQFALLENMPTDHIWWLEFNEHMLAASTEIHLLKLDGWQMSRGVAHELNFADRHGIPVKEITV